MSLLELAAVNEVNDLVPNLDGHVLLMVDQSADLIGLVCEVLLCAAGAGSRAILTGFSIRQASRAFSALSWYWFSSVEAY